MKITNVRKFPIENRWVVHSYYSMNPYAPDGSGRLLCAGCDLETGLGEEGNWCKILFDCDEGFAYVSMKYLSETQPPITA